MSTERFGKRGFCNPKRLPRGPNGRACCRQCQQEVPVGRRSFCSDQCVERWKLKTDLKAQARFLLDRDHGICQLCNLDCIGLLEELQKLRHQCRRERWEHSDIRYDGALPSDRHLEKLADRFNALALPKHLQNLTRRLWEADHIVPVVEGGGDCGPENLRTLCWACHRKETAELRKRLAASKSKPPA